MVSCDQLAFAVALRRPTAGTLHGSLLPREEAGQALRVLALDGLTDAANVGAMMRVAAAFGLSAVLCSGECCDPFNAKSVRASHGYVFRTPVVRGPLAAMMHEL